MEQRLSLVTLGVVDLNRSAHFYEKGLGWQRNSRDEGVIFFQTPGTIVALWPRADLAADAGVPAEGTGFAGVALAYNARSREEVDVILGQAVGAGAKLVKAAQEAFWGGYTGYFSDPDGHLWEVAFNPFWTIDEEGRVSLTAPQ